MSNLITPVPRSSSWRIDSAEFDKLKRTVAALNWERVSLRVTLYDMMNKPASAIIEVHVTVDTAFEGMSGSRRTRTVRITTKQEPMRPGYHATLRAVTTALQREPPTNPAAAADQVRRKFTPYVYARGCATASHFQHQMDWHAATAMGCAANAASFIHTELFKRNKPFPPDSTFYISQDDMFKLRRAKRTSWKKEPNPDKFDVVLHGVMYDASFIGKGRADRPKAVTFSVNV